MGLVQLREGTRLGGTEVQPSRILTALKSPESHNHTDSLTDFQWTFLPNSTTLRRKV